MLRTLIRVVRCCWALDNDLGKTQATRNQFVKDETFWKKIYKVRFTERAFAGDGSICDKVCELGCRFFGYGSSQLTIPTIDERLMTACTEGYEKVVKVLLESGADVNAVSDSGITPLHWAKSEGVARVLLESGADVNATVNAIDLCGITPLHWAKSEGVARALLEAGAAVNSMSMVGTPLHLAVRTGNEKVVRTLLEAGADIEATGLFNETPLHFAKSAGMVRVLLEAGADTTETDHDDSCIIM